LPELIAAQRTHSDSKIWSVITWTNGSYDSTIFLTRVYSRALMQFPRYPAGLSRSFNSNGFFQISAKDIDWTGIADVEKQIALRWLSAPSSESQREYRTAMREDDDMWDQCVICRKRKIFQKSRMMWKKFASSSSNVKAIFSRWFLNH